MSLKLRPLSDKEYDLVAALAKQSGIPIDQCPTCDATRIEVATGVWGWENGTYKYQGETFECDCETQIQLRKHYLVAGIDEQFHRLNWDDYDGSEDVRDGVEIYLNGYNSARKNGVGVEFAGVSTGTGKTFAATHIGKELIKRGHRVHFISFLDVMGLYDRIGGHEFEEYLKTVEVLILDEVYRPTTVAENSHFARKFEELIRHRTNANLPIIMTTNLTQEELHEIYPRPYSLLEAKQIRISVEGEDARMDRIAKKNLTLVLNNEAPPIT